MSAPEPFAKYVGDDGIDTFAVRIGTGTVYFGAEATARKAVDRINASVQRERQAAAAEAYKQAADYFESSCYASGYAVAWLRSRAERTGKGEG